MRGVIVEDDLDRGHCGVGGIEHIEKFDEFATAMAVLDEGVHLAGQQVDAGHQSDRSMALVLVIATDRWMGAGHWAKVGSDGADSLDAGFLVIADDRDRRLLRGSIRDRPAHLNLTIDAKHFGHFWFELGITPLQVITHPRLREGRLLCGLTSCAARILHTVPWASFARLGWP